MTQLATEKHAHMSNFSRLENSSVAPAWLEALRRAAIDRFDAVGFPSTKQEEWRFTNVAPIAKTEFRLAHHHDAQEAALTASRFTFGHDAASELVFINGRFEPQLSKLGKLPRGVRVTNLSDALETDSQVVEQHLGKYADIRGNPFVALNSGFIQEGALIHFSRDVALEQPIHLLFISTPAREPAVTHPRVLVVAEEGASATLVESYVGSGRGVYFTNAVTEIVAGAGARVDHCKLQQENLDAYHVATMQVQLAARTQFVSHSATLGARLTRNDLTAVMGGEFADATLNGLVLISGEQHCDNHTVLDHARANCPSHELYKHVLGGKSSGVFKGKILVRPNAQKTDSKQTSKSLLLTDDATMNAMPALEIYADDVKCTHGSTTGPVDEEQVFYLRQRGVGAEAARHLMTYAFAADITRRIKVEPVRRRLEEYMAAQHGLPLDLRINDLAAHDEAVQQI
ncbi:MAG TPA: Fe-S cluster assembly protein SufD [Humisphaera sp.]|jgi:Fe-S cluster assembly protein SufD|nr:Fe-S cluster assembly protein SufD [Humisphaera sp.]